MENSTQKYDKDAPRLFLDVLTAIKEGLVDINRSGSDKEVVDLIKTLDPSSGMQRSYLSALRNSAKAVLADEEPGSTVPSGSHIYQLLNVFVTGNTFTTLGPEWERVKDIISDIVKKAADGKFSHYVRLVEPGEDTDNNSLRVVRILLGEVERFYSLELGRTEKALREIQALKDRIKNVVEELEKIGGEDVDQYIKYIKGSLKGIVDF